MTAGGQVEISAREAEVLVALGAHRSNAQIAHALHISVRTVESHVSSLLRKYGVADRRALADLADLAAEQEREPAPTRVAGVPASRTTFIGRDRELAAVTAALADARLVTLLGPGGMGKTRLAAVVAGAVAADFPAGGAFVDLVPVRAGLVDRAVATALGVVERPPQPLTDAVLERLRGGRSLLVLDNCEHLLDEAGELVGRVLAECPDVTVVATSRERLAVPGEHLVGVPPLPLSSDAERLFVDRARAADPDFTADPGAVSELCARLDGMPLAIELAAARTPSLGLAGLRTALDDRLRLVAGGRDPDPRHRSLRAVIGWSHDLLDDDERVLLRRLAVFVGGFDLDAACATSPELYRSATADLVGRLADKSLAIRRGTRWRLLETIRDFAAEQLVAAGERDAVDVRHLRWAADTAADLESRIETDWRDEFDETVGDLRAALSGTAAAPDATAHRLARSLGHLTFARRDFVEAVGHYRSAAGRAEGAVDAARDLRTAADATLAVADGPAAYRLLLEAADLVVADGNLRATMLAAAVIAANRYPAGPLYDVPEQLTRAMLEEAAGIADPDDPYVTALLVAARAWDHGDRRIGADEAVAGTAVAAARRTGDPVLVAGALDALGTSTGNSGRLRETRRSTEERMRLVGPLPRHEPYAAAEIIDAFHVASRDAVSTGDLPAALELAELTGTADPAGDHPYIALPRQIRVFALAGRFDAATSRADALWDRWTAAGAPPMEWMSSALSAAAMVHGVRVDGTFDRWRARALEMARVHESPGRHADAAFADARVAVHTGRLDPGLVEASFAPFGERWWAPYACAAGAELAVVAGLPDAADRLTEAGSAAAENDWAAACLARATGRLHGDARALTDAVAQWERIGARFERACTLLLLPARAAEGRAELAALGCPPPAT